MEVEMYKGEGRKKEKGVGVRFIELAIKVRAVKQEPKPYVTIGKTIALTMQTFG